MSPTGADGRSKCSLGCGSNSELRSVTADLCRWGVGLAPPPPPPPSPSWLCHWSGNTEAALCSAPIKGGPRRDGAAWKERGGAEAEAGNVGTAFEIERSSRARRRLSLAADASEGFPQIFPALPASLKHPPPPPSHPSLAASATGSVNEAEDGRLFIPVCRHRFSIGASGSAGRRSRASPTGPGAVPAVEWSSRAAAPRDSQL